MSAADNAITFTITNPNPRFSFINCTVAILNARDVPDVIRDPAKLHPAWRVGVPDRQ